MGELSKAIVSRILDLFLADIGSGGQKFAKRIVNKIKLSKWKKELKSWIEDYLDRHDGTVLTEGRFAHYVKYHKPIEEIYKFACSTELSSSNDSFINSLLTRTKETIEGSIDVNDELEIKYLYKEILFKSIEMRKEILSDNEKVLLRQISHSENKILDAVGEKHDDIIKRIESLPIGEISENDALELFKHFNVHFWNCEFDELTNICPVIEGKSKDLVLWIKLTLSLFLVSAPYKINRSEYLNINCPEMRDDIVLKMFLIAYFENSLGTFDAIPYSEDLKKIISEVVAGNYSSVFTETREKKRNLLCMGLKINSNSNDEMWFVRDIMLLYLFNQPYSSISGVMKEIIGKESDFFADLIFFRQLVSEGHLYKNDEIDRAFSAIKVKREDYGKMIPSISAMFYGSYILYALQKKDKETLCKLLNEIPDKIKKHEYVADYIFLAQMELGTANHDEIASRCEKTGRNWLLHEFYMSLESPLKVVEFARKRETMVLKDIVTYVDYVRALHFIGEIEERDKYLEDYKDVYKDFFEYWTTRIEVLNSSEDVDFFEHMWKTGNYKCYIPVADAMAAEIFYKWKKYPNCIEAALNCEDKGLKDTTVKQYKISSLFQLGKRVEAYRELSDSFLDGDHSSFIVNNLLGLTLELNRPVPAGLIEYVRSQKDPIAFALSAQISEREGLKEEAGEWYRKALVYSDGLDVKICGSYWNYTVQNIGESQREAKCVDIDTALSIRNIDNGELKNICVSDKKYIPDDYYLWNGIIHFSVDKAVQYNLLRKPGGQVEVDWAGDTTRIIDPDTGEIMGKTDLNKKLV